MPTAREVIERHVTACNLREALGREQSLHVEGRVSVSATGAEGTIEMWGAKPGLNRSRIQLGEGVSVFGGYDGNVAWMVHTASGARVFEGLDLLQSRLEADWDEALKEGDLYESLRTVGRERFEGRDCWKLEVVAKPLPGMDAEATRLARTAHELYEVESGLLAGRKTRRDDGGAGVLATTVFSAYRDFGRRRMASQTLVRQDGQETRVTIDAVEFDTVSAGFFRPPAEIQRLLAPPDAR